MSCQKGSGVRSRPQKYQNRHAFKNNLHDTSHMTKKINNIQVCNVCERCKKIIEWKIKYKKYKTLSAPSKCVKCNEKCVKHAYHIMCGNCASQNKVCPKCGEKSEIIKTNIEEKELTLDRELRLMLKKLPERKRRTFMRYMNRQGQAKETEEDLEQSEATPADIQDDKEASEAVDEDAEPAPLTRDDLVAKLQALMLSKKGNGNSEDFDSDSDDDNFVEESESDG